MKLFFFVTGQGGMKSGQTYVNMCPILNLNRKILKIFITGVILPPNRHFRAVLMGLRITGLQVRGYVFELS